MKTTPDNIGDHLRDLERDDQLIGDRVSIQYCGSCRSEAVLLNWLHDGSIEVTCSRCGTVGVRRR